ncbi:MAG: hypothetical protein ABIJ75_07560, partial [Actinomycetota bacterium]
SSRISDLEAGLRSKRLAAAAAAEQEEAALRRVEELEAALATLHSQTDADTGEVEFLQEELETALGSIDTLRREMSEIHASVDEMTALKAAQEAELAPPPDTGAPATGPAQGGLFLVQDHFEPSVGSRRGPEDRDDPSWTVESGRDPQADADVVEAERLAAVAEVTERFRLAEAVEPDDLKRIHGIGPALERLLLSMNIATFRQIAEFDDDDVELVSTALGRAFPDRIRRDDWMASARALLQDPRDGDA